MIRNALVAIAFALSLGASFTANADFYMLPDMTEGAIVMENNQLRKELAETKAALKKERGANSWLRHLLREEKADSKKIAKAAMAVIAMRILDNAEHQEPVPATHEEYQRREQFRNNAGQYIPPRPTQAQPNCMVVDRHGNCR